MAASLRTQNAPANDQEINDKESNDALPSVEEVADCSEEDDEQSSAVDWTELVNRIHRGDDSGMEDLYRLFARGIRFYLCRQLGVQELDDNLALLHRIGDGAHDAANGPERRQPHQHKNVQRNGMFQGGHPVHHPRQQQRHKCHRDEVHHSSDQLGHQERPRRNRRDLEDIPNETQKKLEFIWLERVEDAVAAALLPEKD